MRLTKIAVKTFAKLSREDYARIFDALLTLCATGTGDIKALKGFGKGTLRLRVGQWRMYLIVSGFVIELIDIDQRGAAYKTKSRTKLEKRG